MTEPGAFIPDIWSGSIAASLLRPTIFERFDTRTPEEKAAAKQRMVEKSEKIRTDHAAALAGASSPLVAAMLSLHAPVFAYDGDSAPDCHGCDYSGAEPEPPYFPCRTYKLAAGLN